MITVMFSTYNGATTLPLMLEAMTRLVVPAQGYCIIAILNACTDDSEKILRAYVDRLPLTILEEPAKGKNRALTTGLKHQRSPLLVFTDDDVIPDPLWLVRLEQAARDHPDFDVFGGRILPYWMVEPSAWLLSKVPMAPVFAVHPDNLPAGPVHHGMVWGPNMAVRSRAFDAGFAFNAAVGPDGTSSYSMGSESELLDRLASAGYRCWHCDEARVQHIIRPHQVELAWIVGRAFRYGRFRYGHGEKSRWGNVPLVRGVPRWMWRQYLGHLLRREWFHLLGDEERCFEPAWQVQYFRGLLAEAAATQAP